MMCLIQLFAEIAILLYPLFYIYVIYKYVFIYNFKHKNVQVSPFVNFQSIYSIIVSYIKFSSETFESKNNTVFIIA